MKRVLIDLNILLDFLGKREHHLQAATIMDLCFRGKLTGFICAHEMTTLSYFLRKELQDQTRVLTVLTTLLDQFPVIPVDGTILRDALLSPVKDFEDAVLEVSALKEHIDFILTRDMSDFRSSRVKPLTPEQFLLLEKTL